MRRPTLQSLPPQMRATASPRAPAPDDPRVRLPLANIKPRLRMTTLYFIANSLNYLVAGTGNRAELALGYFTKHGDGGADMLPIGNLHKSEVRALARELQVPSSIIERTPSAGLWAGPDRRGRNGLQLLRPRALPGRRTAGRLAGAGDAHRAPRALERPQTAAPADAGCRLGARLRAQLNSASFDRLRSERSMVSLSNQGSSPRLRRFATLLSQHRPLNLRHILAGQSV